MTPNPLIIKGQQPPLEDPGQTASGGPAETKVIDSGAAYVPGHDTRIERAEARSERAEARTEQAKSRTEQAETRTERAETRTEQAKTRTEQAEARTEEAETRSETAIRSSEVRYRRLFEATKDGILILEADTGRITDVNPFLLEMLGFTREELIGLPIWELGPFRDIVANKARFEELQEKGYVLSENLSLETRGGRKIIVEFVTNVYHAGDSRAIQCNVRDVTERKRVEKALIRLAAIVEFSNDAIIGKDLDGIVTNWNRGAEKLFGYTAGEIVGTSIMRLVPPELQEDEHKILEKIKFGRGVEQLETLQQAKDGRLINVLVVVAPILDADGKVIGASKVVHDITDLKAGEKKIVQLNAELEQRVVERTAQLHTANMELRAANDELDAFSHSVSHDLRAPLRHVLGFVQLLQKDAGPSLSEKNLGVLTTISQAAMRMGQLIEDLLAFAHVGRAALHKSEVNLDGLVQDTVSEIQAHLSGRNIAWEIQPLPTVRADRSLLRLALVNLISNAVKFTGGRAQAKIEIGRAPGAAGETVIFIRDNGAGFNPEYAHKLFGVFQRLHSQEKFEGTGVGLANVQRIIHRHGGRAWAEGAVDTGATFYFSIPN